MKPTEFWKNFNLGTELSIAGAFIYNGLRRFHELRQLNHTDEVFEVFYCLAIGLERLLKITVVLLEHHDSIDQEALEQSLRTHNHLDLIHRVRKHAPVNIGTLHNEFLGLLSTFYKTFRYDRFSLNSVMDLDKEREALRAFLNKHLQVEIPSNALFGISNDVRYKNFIRKTVLKISKALYEIVEDRSIHIRDSSWLQGENRISERGGYFFRRYSMEGTADLLYEHEIYIWISKFPSRNFASRV